MRNLKAKIGRRFLTNEDSSIRAEVNRCDSLPILAIGREMRDNMTVILITVLLSIKDKIKIEYHENLKEINDRNPS